MTRRILEHEQKEKSDSEIMTFRVSAQTIILVETAVISLFITAGYLTQSHAEIVWLVPTILFVHLIIFSAPLAMLKGYDFIIYDAAPNSPWKFYGFIAIFIATLLGNLLDQGTFQLLIN